MDFLKKKFPAYVDTGLNLVDVIDCAEGHLLAMEKARPGERYILGGENLTLKQILDKLGAITGLPSPNIKVPYACRFGGRSMGQLVVGRHDEARAASHHRGRADVAQENVCQPAPKRSASWDGIRVRWMTPCGAQWSGSERHGYAA